MLGIGLSELIVIGVLALIFIGPKELPVVAAKIARFINELRRSTDSFKQEFKSTVTVGKEPQTKVSETNETNNPENNPHDKS